MQDNVIALNNLGLMYRDGVGVSQNYIKAYVLWQRLKIIKHQKKALKKLLK